MCEWNMRPKIDLLVQNAQIITMEPSTPKADALAVHNGRILAIGSLHDLEFLIKSASTIIDLKERIVVPGFIDTHAHLAALGREFLYLDLSQTTSIEEAKQLVKIKAKQLPAGKPLFGFKWDESQWANPRYLTKWDLDPISQSHPIILKRFCGHLISVNSFVLNQPDIDVNHPGVDKDPETGELTGVLREYPFDYRKYQIKEDLSEAILKACTFANSVGVTSVHENLYHRQLPLIAEYLKLRQKNQLTVRVYANLEAKLLDKLAGLELASGLGDEYFRLGGIKVFIDGSLGAQTAALCEPYNDKPESKGLLLKTEEEYRFLLEIANKLELQVSTHAIGDQGIEVVLSAHEKESKASLVKKLRHNIIHAEFLTEPLMKRVKRLGMLLLQQPNFVHRWGLEGGMYDQRLGLERAQQLNNFRKILDNRIRVAFGSDCMPMNPLYGIFSATTHPNPAVRISIKEALQLYTIDAAYASFEEDQKGSLIPGKFADFVVVSHNPLEISPEEVRKVEVLQTFVGGKLVYSGL